MLLSSLLYTRLVPLLSVGDESHLLRVREDSGSFFFLSWIFAIFVPSKKPNIGPDAEANRKAEPAVMPL